MVRLVEASGVELKKGGRDLLGRCPFHEDATASLVVTPAKNLWPRSLTRETGLGWSHSIARSTVNRHTSGRGEQSAESARRPQRKLENTGVTCKR